MMNARHRCLVPQCEVLVGLHKAFCYEHWGLIPPTIQRLVVKTWKARLELRTLERIQAHRNALDAAITAIDQELGPRGTLSESSEGRKTPIVPPGRPRADRLEDDP